MITSPDNQHLKEIRKLRGRRHRQRSGLFVAEGEDLVDAADRAGLAPEKLLVAGVDVEAGLLASAAGLGSGARVVGIYRQRFSEPGGDLAVYLEGVGDPGNVGAIVRSAHAFADGPVILGPGCADPYSPKAVRASMGSVFARPPARERFDALAGFTIALERAGGDDLASVAAAAPAPVVLCLGAERDGLPEPVLTSASARASIAMAGAGPDSLNVAMAATVALYERSRNANRMAARA